MENINQRKLTILLASIPIVIIQVSIIITVYIISLSGLPFGIRLCNGRSTIRTTTALHFIIAVKDKG
jgi:hypothetical protein